MPYVDPTSEQATGQPGRAQTSDGSFPQHNFLSRGSGGHSDGRNADRSDNAWISLAAAQQQREKLVIGLSVRFAMFMF